MGAIIDKAKGRIKQAVGNLTGNEKLKHDGERDEYKGKVEGAFKEMEHAIKDAAKTDGK